MKLTDTSTAIIRVHEDSGLLTPLARGASGYRDDAPICWIVSSIPDDHGALKLPSRMSVHARGRGQCWDRDRRRFGRLSGVAAQAA
uniref:HTH merR-type domain-containing protein n=1 Tax=Mycobacterium riyadhense TaxID=486698 RepID=A0A653EYT5_9MYCO|nr:hypothetical protein BIN_B_04586 [Mycobacterium riyadhense]